MLQWLHSLTSNYLLFTVAGSNPARQFEFYSASLRNIGGSFQVSARAWNKARRGTCGLPPQVKLESCHIIFTVLVRKTRLCNNYIDEDLHFSVVICFLSLMTPIKYWYNWLWYNWIALRMLKVIVCLFVCFVKPISIFWSYISVRST